MENHEFDATIEKLARDTGLDKESCVELVQLFHLNAKETLGLAQKAFKENDKEELRKHIHKIKGSAGNIRANKVWEKASQFEKKIKEESKSDIEKDLVLLEKSIDDLII